MANKYLDFTPKGTVVRYLVSGKGNIYKCNVIAFKEADDCYYCEMPEHLYYTNPTSVEDYPKGFWSREYCYENIERAKEAAVKTKLELIKMTENGIKNARERIHQLEDRVIEIQNEIVDISSDKVSIIEVED